MGKYLGKVEMKKDRYLIFLILGLFIIGIIYSLYNLDAETYILNDINDYGNINLNIKSIQIYADNKKIDLDFDPAVRSYTLILNDATIDNIRFEADLMDDKAFFMGEYYGPREVYLDYGENTAYLVVTSEENLKNTYKFTIIRPSGVATNAKLSYLKINNKEVRLSDELEYLVVLDSDVIKTDIEARTDDKGVKVEYVDINLEYGMNKMVIQLVDEQNIRKNYDINIMRLRNNEKYSQLKTIIIDGLSLDFDVNKYNYDIVIDNFLIDDIPKITVLPIEIINKVSFSSFNNEKKKVTVKILDDCETKTYTFHLINKNELNENELNENGKLIDIKDKNNNYAIYYIFFGMSIIILILSIYYAVVIKKRKKMSI